MAKQKQTKAQRKRDLISKERAEKAKAQRKQDLINFIEETRKINVCNPEIIAKAQSKRDSKTISKVKKKTDSPEFIGIWKKNSLHRIRRNLKKTYKNKISFPEPNRCKFCGNVAISGSDICYSC